MDKRHRRILNHVVERFADRLGDRLRSAFVKGSLARGDAVWGVSDIDFVLLFDRPDEEDTKLRRQVEREALQFEGGDALVIQRVAGDRLSQMDEDTRAYWLYACES